MKIRGPDGVVTAVAFNMQRIHEFSARVRDERPQERKARRGKGVLFRRFKREKFNVVKNHQTEHPTASGFEERCRGARNDR